MSNSNRKSLILKAAGEVFLTIGFEKSTVQEIAIRAGVGKGTIYEYFESKEALFVEMIQNFTSIVFADVAKLLEKVETIEELIDGHIKLALYHIEQHSDKVRILFEDLAKVSKDLHDWIIEKNFRVFEQISGIVQQFIDNKTLRDVNPKVVAWSISEITRLGFISKIVYKEQDVEAILLAHKDVLLNGCRA